MAGHGKTRYNLQTFPSIEYRYILLQETHALFISDLLLRIITTIACAEHLKTDPDMILSIFLQGLIFQQYLVVKECRQLSCTGSVR